MPGCFFYCWLAFAVHIGKRSLCQSLWFVSDKILGAAEYLVCEFGRAKLKVTSIIEKSFSFFVLNLTIPGCFFIAGYFLPFTSVREDKKHLC